MRKIDSSISPRSWFRRLLLGATIVVLALAVCGMIYENIAEARDRRFNLMEGRMAEVNGHKMHIDCTGRGTPTVILESGLGDTYLSWRKVQPEIAKFTRVCSYDRAGLGYSDGSSRPRTSEVIAKELHALLQSAGVQPPYILVGHSLGGFDVRVFAAKYRSEVAGMVLVDSSHPDQQARLPLEIRNLEGSWMREAEFLSYTMPFGIPRLLGLCDTDAVVRAADCNYATSREALAEMKAIPESASQTRATGPFGDLPLVVISHDPEKPSSEMPPDLAKLTNQAWQQMQTELSHLSTRGSLIIARNSAHYVQLDRPDVVVGAVHYVIDITVPLTFRDYQH